MSRVFRAAQTGEGGAAMGEQHILNDNSIGKIFLADNKGDLPIFQCGYCNTRAYLEINTMGGSIWNELQYLCKNCRSTFLFTNEPRVDKSGKHVPRFGKLIEIWREAGPLYAE